MSAVMSSLAPDSYTSTETRSVDELNAASGRVRTRGTATPAVARRSSRTLRPASEL